MHKSLYTALFVAALTFISSSGIAGGYQINEKNARGMGRGYAGEAAAGENATTVGSNPAAMSRLKRPEFSISASTVDASAKIEVKEANLVIPALQAAGLGTIQAEGSRTADAAPKPSVIPALYAVYPISNEYALGLGVFSNFASESNFDDSFSGRILAQKSRVTTLDINPSLSFKMSPMLSFGVGFNGVYAQAELSSSNPSVAPLKIAPGLTALNPQTGEAIVAPNGLSLGNSTLKGDAWGFGWNAGMLLTLSENSRLGLAYRSTVDLSIEGDATFQNVPTVDAFSDFAANSPLQLPAIISLSYVQGLPGGFQLSADMTQTRWSNFEELNVYRKNGGQLSSTVDERWNDSIRYAVGLDYALSSNLGLRTGYAYDNSPIPDEHRTLRIPTGDLRMYSLGGSYKFSETASLDLAYALLKQSITAINDTRNFLGQPFYAKVEASSKVDAALFAAQMNLAL